MWFTSSASLWTNRRWKNSDDRRKESTPCWTSPATTQTPPSFSSARLPPKTPNSSSENNISTRPRSRHRPNTTPTSTTWKNRHRRSPSHEYYATSWRRGLGIGSKLHSTSFKRLRFRICLRGSLHRQRERKSTQYEGRFSPNSHNWLQITLADLHSLKPLLARTHKN